MQKQVDLGEIYLLSNFLNSNYTNKIDQKPQNCPPPFWIPSQVTPTGYRDHVVCHLRLRKPNSLQLFLNSFYSLICALKPKSLCSFYKKFDCLFFLFTGLFSSALWNEYGRGKGCHTLQTGIYIWPS